MRFFWLDRSETAWYDKAGKWTTTTCDFYEIGWNSFEIISNQQIKIKEEDVYRNLLFRKKIDEKFKNSGELSF